MPGIVFYFENTDKDVYSGRETDLDAWRYAAYSAGDITDLIVINESSTVLDPENLDLNFNWQIVSSMPALTGTVTKVVCPWESGNHTSLWDFDHNTDWYVFGPASGWAGPQDGVCIPQSGQASEHSAHIMSTIMFHRYKVINSL